MQTLTERFRVVPGDRVRLDERDTRDAAGLDKQTAAGLMEQVGRDLFLLQRRLHAESRRALLIILQGMDASGKDGTIRAAFGPLNPQGTRVIPFKAPTSTELAHDYLWRIHGVCPPRGDIHIFNRSHYEDVLVVRVEGLVPEEVWRRRYDHINALERLLHDEGTVVLKFFLHLSPQEQRERLLARIRDPERHFKFNAGDFESRRRWDDYTRAYEEAIERCSTDHAPWHIIPADRNWLRNYAVAAITLEALREMDPRLPSIQIDQDRAERLLDP